MMAEVDAERRSGSGGVPVHKAPNEQQSSLQDLILSCNKDGMESLRRAPSDQQGPELKAAFEQFKYAEAILLANQSSQDNAALLAVTCNNLGCYYKKVGKYHGALSYLRRALKMEVELKADEMTIASTQLNISAILSKLDKHDKAIQHALAALEMIGKRVTKMDPTTMSDDTYSVLALAYHSVGREREFLEQWDQAAMAFQTGYQVATRLLGENHPLSITLGRNAEAILHKSRTHSKVKPSATRAARKEQTWMADHPGGGANGSSAASGAGTVKLPPLPGADPSPRDLVPPAEREWKGEEALWMAFAAKALDDMGGGTSAMARDLGAEAEKGLSALDTPAIRGPLAAQALQEMQDAQHHMPKAHDMGGLRMKAITGKSVFKQTPFGEALEKNPEALMDIMDAEVDGQKSKVQDYRPNRSMKRQTRTSRVVRRTGNFNCMSNRDQVEIDLARRRLEGGGLSKETQRLAAIRIQRIWREWYKYCQENSEWMTITWICATMIQSHWRSYHVRRQIMDKHASNIQRQVRGYLVRKALRKHKAATAIQRVAVGMITRNKLKHLHQSATHMQRLVRGGLARRRYKRLHGWKTRVVVILQRYARQWMAKREIARRQEERRQDLMLVKATIDLQRLFRGYKGRQRAQGLREEYLQRKRQTAGAIKIQRQVRRVQAAVRVDVLRRARMTEMEKAATLLRKMWLGARTRRKYQQLRREYKAAEGKIITIQRFVRGCMCRLRLWREAVEAQERLWAAIEIQRCWRGYSGRVRFENCFEELWRREMMAVVVQRNFRGHVARSKVRKLLRAHAREEFELARTRFRAAQRIQALARGVHSRKRTRHRLALCTYSAVQIQRIARGWSVRRALWNQVIHQKATVMAALVRGFLVRRRKRRMLAKVIRLQRAYRRFRNLPLVQRQEAREVMLDRKRKAALIQKYYRQAKEHKELQRIAAAAALPPPDVTPPAVAAH